MAIIFIFIATIIGSLISGCTPSITSKVYEKDLPNNPTFTINFQVPLTHKYVRPDGSIAYTNYEAPKLKLDSDDLSVTIYDNVTPPCSPSLTGASTTTPLPNANGTAEWGRVDFFEKYVGEGYVDYMGETPLCAEPGSAKDRYALCSHKDGKTVVICISQMTQNEPLAKQIFDTFRWTK